MIAVLSVSSLSRSSPHTWSGATQSRGGSRSVPSVSHSTSASELAAIRSAVAKSSWTLPLAWVSPASASSDGSALGNALISPRAASRTNASASARSSGSASNRPGLAVSDRAPQHVGGVVEITGRVAAVGLHVPGRPPRGPLDLGRPQLVGRRLGHPGRQLVGLVDHHDVVLRNQRHALDRVDREQRVVGDDQVGALRLLPGALGEALLAERALRGAEALARGDADLPPGRGRCGAARRPGRRCRSTSTPPRPTRAAPSPSCRARRAPRRPGSARPGRRARPRGSGAGRRSWSDP